MLEEERLITLHRAVLCVRDQHRYGEQVMESILRARVEDLCTMLSASDPQLIGMALRNLRLVLKMASDRKQRRRLVKLFELRGRIKFRRLPQEVCQNPEVQKMGARLEAVLITV